MLILERQPVPIDDFERHVSRMHMDGDHGFSEEYSVRSRQTGAKKDHLSFWLMYFDVTSLLHLFPK